MIQKLINWFKSFFVKEKTEAEKIRDQIRKQDPFIYK